MRSTPLSHLFVETDESPTPIEKIYEKLAELLGTSVVELITATEDNFKRIFNS
jgi:TatD DNase family protein